MEKTIRSDRACSASVTDALDRIRIVLEDLPEQIQERNKLLVEITSKPLMRVIVLHLINTSLWTTWTTIRSSRIFHPVSTVSVKVLIYLSEPGLTSIMTSSIRSPRATRS